MNILSSTENKDEASFLNRHLLKIGLVVLFIGVTLIAFAPYVFTQFSIAYNLTDKGTIGDAIGGTTAPIASLVGSVLVFLSLYAQIQANRLVLEEFKEERDRYKREETERATDKITQQQNELFKVLLNMIELQNQELINFKFGNNSTGIESLTALGNHPESEAVTRHVSVLIYIIVSLQFAIGIAKKNNFQIEQKLLLTTRISSILSKFDLALYLKRKNVKPEDAVNHLFTLIDQTREEITNY